MKLAYDVTIEQATLASQIAQNEFIFWQDSAQTKPEPPGTWANLPVAQVWIDAASASGVVSVDSTGAVIPASVSGGFQSFIAWVQKNMLLAVFGGAVLIWGIYTLVKKK